MSKEKFIILGNYQAPELGEILKDIGHDAKIIVVFDNNQLNKTIETITELLDKESNKVITPWELDKLHNKTNRP